MIALITFWLIIQLIALAAFPLVWRLCLHLPDRGYGLTKPLGLLLTAFLLWFGASLGFLRNSLGGAIAALLIVAALSLWLLWHGDSGGALLRWLRENRRLIIVSELLFAVALALWAYFRAFDPAISATEKPMELMFLNSVLHSQRFPPLDAWLSGYSISYYYFGYVMLALLTRLSGLPSEIAFNLGLAAWFALVASTAFSVGFNLTALLPRPLAPWAQQTGPRTPDTPHPPWRASLLTGLLAALFVVVIGNQQGILEFGYHNRLLSADLIRATDIKEMTDAAPSGQWYIGEYWWWWRASRVIHDRDLAGNTIEVIDEFPNFSFILGDMHPHVLALPFVIMAIGLALNLMLSAARPADAPDDRPTPAALLASLPSLFPLGGLGLGLYALALGGLSFLNTWDFPIYLTLTVLAVGLVHTLQRRALDSIVLLRTGALFFTLAVLGIVLYLPFYLGFQSQAGGLLPNLLFPTRFIQYVVIFAPFLVALLAFAALLTLRQGWSATLRRTLAWLPWTLGLPIALVLTMLLLARIVPTFQNFVRDLLANPTVQAQTGGASLDALLGLVLRVRLANPWTFLILALLIAWFIALLDGARRPAAPSTAGSPLPLPALFALLLGALALLLTFAPEFIYLKDNFGTRMNTVFKFYYQAWTLLALASAFIVAYLAAPSPHTPQLEGQRGALLLRRISLALIALLTLTGLYYPVAAGYSKAGRFARSPSLDGLAYLRQYNPGDYAAIAWLRQNAVTARVVLEASGGSYDRDGAGRISMSTGIPTLLGWDGHEAQWRGRAYGLMAQGRTEAIEAIYRTADPTQLSNLLTQWGVDYVVVGALERNKYRLQPGALARLDRALDLVYDENDVRIYRRRGPLAPTAIPPTSP